MPATGITAVHPAARDRRRPHRPSTGHRFPVDGPHLPEVRVGDAARARRVRVADAPRRRRPAGLDGGRAPGATLRRCRRDDGRLRRHRRAVRHRAPPGRQPGVRSRRQPLRHLQRHARPAGAGVDLPRAAERHARDVFIRHRQPDVDGDRSDGAAVRLEPLRGHGLPGDAGRIDGSRSRTDLGVACGLAFAPDGTLFVGDRSGTIFRVDRDGARDDVRDAAGERGGVPSRARRRTARSTSPAPTLSSYDPLYRIEPDGTVATAYARFGRPQGLAFDPPASLFVVEALAGASGLYRVPTGRRSGAGARRSGAGRRRVRWRRHHRRRVERNGLPASLNQVIGFAESGNRVIG